MQYIQYHHNVEYRASKICKNMRDFELVKDQLLSNVLGFERAELNFDMNQETPKLWIDKKVLMKRIGIFLLKKNKGLSV